MDRDRVTSWLDLIGAVLIVFAAGAGAIWLTLWHPYAQAVALALAVIGLGLIIVSRLVDRAPAGQRERPAADA